MRFHPFDAKSIPARAVSTLLFITALLGALRAQSVDRKKLERNMQSTYGGQVLTLRHFYNDNALRFNADGSLARIGTPGPWTLYGLVKVATVKLTEKHLKFRGKRIYVSYNQEENAFHYHRTREPLLIEIECSTDAKLRQVTSTSLSKIFLTGSSRLADVVPPYWREFLLEKSGGSGKPISGKFGCDLSRSRDGTKKKAGINRDTEVDRAHLISSVSARYSKAARLAGIQGTVSINAVIDKLGNIKCMRIVEPLGMGLDEAAAEALAQWKFSPVLLNGNPVEGLVYVNLDFTLERR